MDSNTWLEAKFSLGINPSSANFLEVYFHCDSSRQNGWILRMGDADDDLQLFQRKNGVTKTVLKGAKGYFNRNKSNITLRIVKQPEQIILLYKDSAWDQFQCLGAGIDTMPPQQFYHGWSVTQSGTSAAGKHVVEQWYIGPPRPDRTPCWLKNIEWINTHTARLEFSEPIQPPEPHQFICNRVASDSILESNSRVVLVKFPFLHCNQINVVHCQNLLDTANNVSPHLLDSSMVECATPIYANQIIFTEIMVDPTPSVGFLPNTQYLEIYNTTDTSKWIHTLTLSDPQTSCALPKFLLPPKSYLLLHENADTQFHYLKNKALYVNKMPHFNVDGDAVFLTYNKDTIHQLNYSDKWYHPLYRGGGYSLEKTNIHCGCINPYNWHSNHDLGGTPGRENSTPIPWPSPRTSVLHTEPPLSRIIHHQWKTNNVLEIVMSSQPEPLDTVRNPPNQSPKLLLVNTNGDTLKSKFINSTKKGWLFYIETTEPVDAQARIFHGKDCAHRPLLDTQFQVFKSTSTAETGDLRFNEVMFNAADGLIDFLEIVNPSSKAIDLLGLELIIETEPLNVQRIAVCNESKVLYPNQVICFSADPYLLNQTYNVERSAYHLRCSDFPNLPANGASLKLTDRNTGSIIDIMQYYENMHTPLLSETKGVSLEKNQPKAPSASQQFWISAAATSGFATPAETNSQQVSLNSKKPNKKCFGLIQPVVETQAARNGEGYTQLMLTFHMPQPGYILTASIYNLQGGLMGIPIYHTVIGLEGVLPIPILSPNAISDGNYILHIDAFHRDADLCVQNLHWVYLNR